MENAAGKSKALREKIREMLPVLGGDWILEESVVMYPAVKVAPAAGRAEKLRPKTAVRKG